MLPKGRSILYADDDPEERSLMLESIKEAGVHEHLSVVEDGEQVIEYLSGAGAYADRKKHPLPGLAILDLNMPRKDGFEALAWIRRSERWGSLPVLILSASAQPRDILVGYKLGATAFLVKPSTLQELFELTAAVRDFWLRFARYPEGWNGSGP